MRDVINQAVAHPLVRGHAERAVNQIGPTDRLGEVLAVRDYISAHTMYRRDPFQKELLQTPWWVLQCHVDRGERAQLDCDDLTMLSLSMLGSIGFPTRIRVVSTRTDERYNHVYGLAGIGDRFYKLDMTKVFQRPDAMEEDRPETRAFELEV